MSRFVASLLVLVSTIVLAASFALADAPVGTPSPAPPSGLAPMPNDQRVPRKLLPPGADDPDRGPSEVVFPRQDVTIRFNHKLHVKEQKQTCTGCHKNATTSTKAEDRLLPAPTVCDDCHMVDHGNLGEVKASDAKESACAFCHVGYREGDGNRVAPLRLPRPNAIMNHQKHAARNIGCAQCHGAVEELELATRDQLPRMKGCFSCHQMPDSAARGAAKASCDTCHVRNDVRQGGRLQTVFAGGKLYPPRWLHNAGHTPDFIERHKAVAANDSEFCANCHREEFCTDCHDGRTRPRSIHPNDYLSMHAIEARQATQKCTSCHREQSFCLTCHQRLGITMTGPSGVRESVRFHPPKDVWSNAPRRPGHHAFEAERNLNACVSCHVERDCVVCHGGQGVGGGFNPHRAGFSGNCGTQLRRNPRPCFVCHDPGDGVLSRCR